MGKSLQHQDTISLEYGSPGCMRGLFHHLHHPKWQYVKKRLPHRRHSSGPPAAVARDPECVSDTTARTEEGKLDGGSSHPEILAKSSESSSVHRRSVRSRIKALVTEEVSKRRGRHCRSSSYPARLPLERTTSIHHLEDSTLDCSVKSISYGETMNHQYNVPSTVSSLLDPLLPNIYDESTRSRNACEPCASMCYLRKSEVTEVGKHSVKDHNLLQDSLVYAIEQSKKASLQESKFFLDALDLLSIRKEFFLKVFQDPNSSLSHQLRRHRESVTKLRLHKSLSFPVTGASVRTVTGPNNRSSAGENEWLMSNAEPNSHMLASMGDTNGCSVMPTATSPANESPTNSLVDTSLGSPIKLKDRHSNKLVMKHFRRLREKVKHVINENKKERYRIIRDAILHKVPYGRGYPKDNKKEVGRHPGSVSEKYVKYRSASSLNSKHLFLFARSGICQMRRTSSFNESLERYNRLLELCLSKEVQRASDTSRPRMSVSSSVGSSPVLLGRILSLPDLRSYSLSHLEGFPTTSDYSPDVLAKPLPDLGSARVGGQNSAWSDDQTNLDPSYKHRTQESLEVGISNDLEGLEKREDGLKGGSIIEAMVDSTHVSKFEDDAMETSSTMFSAHEDLEPMLEDSCAYDEDLANLPNELSVDYRTLPESNIVINEGETQTTQTSDNMVRIQVDKRIESEFNYVRDVLELSGFNGKEFVKQWHAAEQPLDPFVFEEVEEFLVAHSNTSENKGSWNHILLFDLINEVLLDMCQRLFSYWPVPLTCCCRVHRIPVGYHVLEEVWENISWHLSGTSEVEPSLDGAVSRDLSEEDGWMNIQFEAECVGLELEGLILDDLLRELF